MPEQVLTADVLGPPYTAETIELPPDDEGPVVATLVSRRTEAPARGAVLSVHGYCDYFFQTAMADFWVDRGYDFYALDLRKYGRSLRSHQTPNFALDIADYYADLDAALALVRDRDGHSNLVVTGHSTGGLITASWLNAHRPPVTGLVLNSPWLDLTGSALMRRVGGTVVDKVGAVAPRRIAPRAVRGLYGQSLHRDHSGEWDYNLDWKPLESFPVRFGWLRAVLRAQAEVHRGIDVGCPVLMLTSAASAQPVAWHDAVVSTDIVLDVELMWRWASRLGSHVTMARIAGALHDVTLSREPVRRLAFEETARWTAAYVERD